MFRSPVLSEPPGPPRSRVAFMSVFRSAGRLMAVLTALLVLPAMLVLPQSASASEAGHSGSAIAVKVHVARDAASGASPRTCYAVSGHFISRYNQNPGGWGCAVTPEYAYLDGTYQEFANGEMDWSPSQGGNMVVSGLRYPGGIYFQFGPSDPFNYDAWLVRISQEGGGTFQPECSSGSNDGQGNYCDRSNGAVHLGTTSTGHWQIITEGCDVSWTGSHTCRQSWTIPVDIWY